jgi:hypothetical protein
MGTQGLDGSVRTFPSALPAENAEVFIDDGRFSHHDRVKAAIDSLELFDFGACMDRNQGMFPQLFDIRPQRTKGAVIRRIEFIELCNLAAEDASLLHEMNGMTAIGEVESRANPGDAAANNQNRRCIGAIHLLIFLFFNDPV